jgi:hypothetical protein
MEMNIPKNIIIAPLLSFLLISFCGLAYADRAKIQGDYCYQYGDSESLMVAKEIAYAMALRKAIETYKTFISSTLTVTDVKLKKDIIEAIASGYVDDIYVVKQDIKEKTVCTTVVGYVNPQAVKSIISRKVERVRQTKRKPFEGIVSNNRIEILNYTRDKEKFSAAEIAHRDTLTITYRAKEALGKVHLPHDTHPSFYGKILVHCFDSNGDPMEGVSRWVPDDKVHLSPGEVRTIDIILPRQTTSFELGVD